MAPKSRRAAASTGFTIVEILVVLVIVAILLAMAMALTRGVSAAQKRATTATRIAAVDAAIVQYVMRMRQLPCPADGSIPSGGVNAGVEVRDASVPTAHVCTGNQARGVVPWVTLGISETDASDGWDRRLTYRTNPNLIQVGAMDMSACDPAGAPATVAVPPNNLCNTACNAATLATTCTPPANFLLNKGLVIQSIVGANQMNPVNGTGAAYILISPGDTGGGAYLGSGTLAGSTTTDGNEEQKNYANLGLQGYYLDDTIMDVAGASHFDDIVSRPSVLAVITKAALGPRSH